MSYSRFNRHEHMSQETRRDILELIKDIQFGYLGYSSKGNSIINMLYGLFDGYLYDELITEVECLKPNLELYNRIIRINTLCSGYPIVL
jgi:hypothetical protein